MDTVYGDYIIESWWIIKKRRNSKNNWISLLKSFLWSYSVTNHHFALVYGIAYITDNVGQLKWVIGKWSIDLLITK
jgi:hypothetical protein